MDETITRETRSRAIAAAQGKAPFDLLLTGGTLVDVATAELRAADIGVVGPMIASVHPRASRSDAATVRDISGLYVAPGFIDAHVHFESSLMIPEHFSAAVVPRGTTTIFTDPHELANVLGLAGMRYAIAASRNLPLRFIFMAPSCVPSTPGLEQSGAEFLGPEMQEMLSWPEIAGVAEVMDMAGVLEESDRMVAIVTAGLASGKLVEGHARGLSGARLQAYMAAGISSDHEIISGEDIIEKLRAGMTVELRGSHDYVLPGVVEQLNKLPHIPQTLCISTDDVFPNYLVDHGGIDDVLRRLIRYGLDPVQAIRCATLNAAQRLERRDLGLIAAGRCADLVLLADLRTIAIKSVYTAGRLAAEDGALVAPIIRSNAKLPTRTVKLDRMTADQFRVPVEGMQNGRAIIRAIKGARFTQWTELEVEVRDGFAAVPPGMSVMVAVHRHGRRKPVVPQAAILDDWGEWCGALATTLSHDSHNLVVFGRDPADMAVAANAVIGSGGGFAVVKGGQVTAHVKLPVAGLLSLEPPAELSRAFTALQRAADEVAEWKPPYRVFRATTGACLACNAGPHLTDLGLTDGTTRQIMCTLVRAA